MKKKASILWIDRGSKYIGVAYAPLESEIIFPVGYLMNDQMIFFNLADLLKRYNVRTIVLWWPTKQKDIQEKITKFINNLNYIIEKDEITIEVIDEDYSSVESGEIVSDFKKNATSDTISAMIILERRLEKKKKEEKSE